MKSIPEFLKDKFSNYKHIYTLVGVLLLVLIILYFFMMRAPNYFPTGSLVLIEKGTTLAQAGENFKDAGVIKSTLAFKMMVRLLSGDGGVIAGK